MYLYNERMLLTVDSKELDIDYTGFSKEKIQVIKETFVLFQHVNLQENKEFFEITIDGKVFGKSNYVYELTRSIEGNLVVTVIAKFSSEEKVNSELFCICLNKQEKKFFANHITDLRDYVGWNCPIGEFDFEI